MIVDYDGRILSQADPGPGEKVVVAPISVQALRDERERAALVMTRLLTLGTVYTPIYPRKDCNLLKRI